MASLNQSIPIGAVAGNSIYVPELISDDDDDEEYDGDPDLETLSSSVKSRTINFPIRATYTNWEPREAFRELVQNWRDAIIKSFRLAEQDFSVIRREKTVRNCVEIVYEAQRTRDDAKESLGYIRFKEAVDGEGTIDITNRSAILEPWHLDLGGTSKANDGKQAGAHGEGLKVALLVLMRGPQNHSVRCRSGGFNWTFNFTTRGRLVARLHRISPRAILKAEHDAKRLMEMRNLIPFAAKPDADVQLVIGELLRGRDEEGDEVRRRRVRREDFDAWTKAALFLYELKDGAVISTRDGDLLTDSQLRGHIYLKGLLLSASTPEKSASITNQPLKFGYNFASGKTNRERQSVASANQEARAILAIWSRVLADEDRPEMVAELSALLNTAEPEYADVAGAKRHMDFATARRLREYLFGDQFAGTWYYCSKDKNKNPRLDHIIQGLGCAGVELTNTYWAILHRHNLILTAEEEEQRRFKAAAPVTTAESESAFATSVRRLLRACLRACPKTKDSDIMFVQAGELHLQLYYSEVELLFRIHERWLSLPGAVEELGLPRDLPADDGIFHSVKRLFADALEQLPRDLFVEEGNSRTAEWRRKLEVSLAEQRLLNYLRMDELRIDSVPGVPRLVMTYAVNSGRALGAPVEIQCHTASRCFHLRDSLLTAEDACTDKMTCVASLGENNSEQGSGESANFQPPTCRVYRYNRPKGEHCEEDLEGGEEYFFVLSTPTDPSSFVRLSTVATTDCRRAASPPVPNLPSLVPNVHRQPAFPATRVPKTRMLEPQDPRADPTHEPPRPSPAPEGFDGSIPGGGGVSPSPSPSPEGAATLDSNLPSAGALSGTKEPAAADASKAPLAGSFVLGLRLHTLDILKIGKERWYEARNSEGVQAFIGILSGENFLPEESRKRPRLE